MKNWRFYLRYFFLKSTQIFWKFYGKRYQWERTQLISKYYASIIEKKLHGKKIDFIFSDNGTIELANLNTDIPIIFLSDTTFHLMLDYYEGFSNLSNSSVRQGEYLEQQVIDKANLCVFLSQWALNSAISHYKADKSKVIVIPIGPNINKKLLPSFNDIKSKKHAQICELLLIGVDWERKGCDIAVNTVEKLNKMGISSHLTICGCEPPKGKSANKFTTVIPFLSKNDPKDMVEIISLFNKATYFIFSTRAECLGISLIEACAFGLPVLASDTGGVSEIVNDGENGFLFSLDDGAEKYAEKIAKNFQDKDFYRKMSLNAYQLIPK